MRPSIRVITARARFASHDEREGNEEIGNGGDHILLRNSLAASLL
jgi:hypothetical protein